MNADRSNENGGAAHPATIDIRTEFPIKEQYAFLNHASVAPIPATTQAAIARFAQVAAEEGPANYVAWLHGMSLARQAAAAVVNAPAPEDVCFVKSTNHGLNIVANSVNWDAGDNVVWLDHEFPANVLPWKGLTRLGVEGRVVPEGADHRYSVDDIAARIDARTRLVAVSWVEYATGTRNDLAAIGALCRDRGVMFCVDGIQGLGVLPMDVQALGIDFLMADGHKWMLAPEGCGILYVRRERIAEMNTSMCGWCGLKNPQDYGNVDQDYKADARRFEEGSHNLMSIIALGASLRLLLDAGLNQGDVATRIRALTTLLMESAAAKGWRVATPTDWHDRAGIVALDKPGMDGAPLVAGLLKDHKIQVAFRRGFIRAAPHFYNDESEIARLVDALP